MVTSRADVRSTASAFATTPSRIAGVKFVNRTRYRWLCAFSVQDDGESLFSSDEVRTHQRGPRIRPSGPRAHPPPAPRKSVYGHRLPLRRQRGLRSRPVAPNARRLTTRPNRSSPKNLSTHRIFLPIESSYPDSEPCRALHFRPARSHHTLAPTPDRTSDFLFFEDFETWFRR